jgi:hypothetical protein
MAPTAESDCVSTQWALIAEGSGPGSRSAVAAAHALDAAGYSAAVTVSTRTLASASRYCRRRIRVPDPRTDPAGYVHAIRDELSRNTYVAVLPANDLAAALLIPAAREFQDKLAWPLRAAAAGLQTPPGVVVPSTHDLQSAADDLGYPVVVKPGSKQFMALRIDTAEQLARFSGTGPLIIQRFVDLPMRGVLGLMWKGQLAAAVHIQYLRIWPVPCGTASAAATTPPDPDLERRLEGFLAGYDGLFHVDLVGPYLIDVNPRLHATLLLALAAGVNLTALYCDLVQGASARPVRGTAGHRYRWIEGDVRCVLDALRHRRLGPLQAARALVPERGTAHSYESLTDPGPSVLRIAQIAERGLRSTNRSRGPRTDELLQDRRS